MTEYIERETLPIKRINIGTPMFPLYKNVVYVEDIATAPTADVAPVVHGRWLDGKCTNCAYEAPDFISYVGYELDDWEPTPYCPHCGAKMDGE